MRNNQFLQWFLFGKQKRHRQTYFHLMAFSAFVIIFKINQIGCEDKSVRNKYEDDEPYLERSSKDSQEDLSYDPWRESERPKLFVDYLNGPLKGKKNKYSNDSDDDTKYYFVLRYSIFVDYLKNIFPSPSFYQRNKDLT